MLKIKLFFVNIFSNSLLNDSFWSLFGNFLAKGLALIGGIFVARLLGKDIFGEYGILKNTLIVISVFSTFGLGYTSTKFISENKNIKPELIPLILRYSKKITIILSSLIALVVFVFSDLISIYLFSEPQISNSLRIISLLIVISSLISTQIGILSGFGVFKLIARIDIIVGIISFIITIILTYFWDLNGALFALFITQILNYIFNERLLNAYVKENFKKNELLTDRKTLFDIIRFSLPIALQEAVYSISQWTINILLLRYATFGDLGMYTAAMQWNAIILFIPGVLRNVILSHLADANNDTFKHNIILKRTLMMTFIVVVLCVLCVYSLSGFISNFYGKSFFGLNELINVAVFSTIFISLSNVYAQAYMSRGLNWEMFFMRFFRDFGVIFIYFIFVKITSFNFVFVMLYSILINSFIFFILMAYYYYQKTKIQKTYK